MPKLKTAGRLTEVVDDLQDTMSPSGMMSLKQCEFRYFKDVLFTDKWLHSLSSVILVHKPPEITNHGFSITWDMPVVTIFDCTWEGVPHRNINYLAYSIFVFFHLSRKYMYQIRTYDATLVSLWVLAVFWKLGCLGVGIRSIQQVSTVITKTYDLERQIWLSVVLLLLIRLLSFCWWFIIFCDFEPWPCT